MSVPDLESVPDFADTGVVLHQHLTREEWLEGRRGMMTASNVAVLFNVSPYHSHFSLACELKGARTEFSEKWVERMEIARAMEPVVASLFAAKTGLEVIDLGEHTIATHSRYKRLGATLDRAFIADGRVCPLELKAPGAYASADWQDEAPLAFQVQAHVQMMCTGADRAAVAAIIGGVEFRYQFIEFNPALAEEIDRRVQAFMTLLDNGGMPDVDGSDHTAAAIKALHPKDSGATITMPPCAQDWYDELQRISARESLLDSQKKETQARIKLAMGDASFGKFPGGQFSWKHQGGNPTHLIVPLGHEAALTAAGIPFETKRSSEYRALRMSNKRAA